MELSAYLAIIRRWWLTLVAAAWVAGLFAYLLASGIPSTYEARARILVGPVNGTFDQVRAAASLVETYAQLAESTPILAATIETLELDTSVRVLDRAVRVTASTISRILTIDVEASDPAVAARIADAIADELIALEGREARRPEGALEVIEPGTINPEPVAPDVPILTVLAAGFGLIGAFSIVFAIEYLSDAIRDRHDLVAATGSPVLGTVEVPADFRPDARHALIVEARPESRSASDYRMLAGLLSTADGVRPRSVLIVGTQPGDGAAEVAANLAAVLSRSGRRVAVVDANERDAELSRLFTSTSQRGVSNLIGRVVSGKRLSDQLRLVETERAPRISVIGWGSVEAPILRSGAANEVVETLLERFDIVLVSAAPIQRSGSTLGWASASEGALLVAQRDLTKRSDLQRTVRSLSGTGTIILGTALLRRRRTWLRRRAVAGSQTPAGRPAHQ